MTFEPLKFTPIGYLESCYKDKFGTPRQPGLSPHALSQLKLRSDLQPQESLDGLEGFSHIWIIFVFHENQVSRFHAKVHPPRLSGKSMGLFATRTPHRPNPIGLSLVKLEKIEDGIIYLSGADLIDGTPVLDIKPYIPDVEAVPYAKVGWVSEVPQRNIDIDFSDVAEAALSQWMLKMNQSNLKQLIKDTIRLDPRPNVYKGFEGADSPYRKNHVFRLYDKDICFEFVEENRALVTEIRDYRL